MRVFLTGYRGFAGRYLSIALESVGAVVVAFKGDIRDEASLRRALTATRPDAIAHLAALTSVADSWMRPRDAWDVNATGTLNLLLATRICAPEARVLVVSSAEVYGAVPIARQPIAEQEPLRPLSPYGVSKAAAEIAALSSGLDVVVARAFPHVGPGQDERFAIASFAAQIARIERGEREPVLHVGNLDAVRDLGDVRDTVDAYRKLVESSTVSGVANVATGRGTRMHDALTMLLSMSTVPISVQHDASRARVSDIPTLVGDSRLLANATDWKPVTPLAKSLADVLNAYRGDAAHA